MIPGISPPTDNLYKLIALFGLGILILGVLNISDYQDDLLVTKIEIEDIEKSIFDTISNYTSRNLAFETDATDKLVNFKDFDKLVEELDEVEKYVFNLKDIPESIKAHVATQIDIIEIKSSVSRNHLWLNYFLIIFSAVFMSVGFIFWYYKEQKWKDIEIITENN